MQYGFSGLLSCGERLHIELCSRKERSEIAGCCYYHHHHSHHCCCFVVDYYYYYDAGLLCQIFNVLLDYGTISPETFPAWKDNNDPAEQAGKGVALKSLTQFFTSLAEVDDDSCEDS